MESEDRERLVNAWVDRALKQYGAEEPRIGLENRILANLRAERRRRRSFSWSQGWAWFALATVLAMAAAVFLMRNHAAIAPMSAANHPAVPAEITLPPSVASGRSSPVASRTRAKTHRSRSLPESVSSPRLNSFPSPQPLSEQEQLLARYVEQFHRQAVLVAEAQTELLKNESLDQKEGVTQNGIREDSQQENP